MEDSKVDDATGEQTEHQPHHQHAYGRAEVLPQPVAGRLPGRRRPRPRRLAALPAVQVVCKLGRRAVALARVLLKALEAKRLQVAVHLRIQGSRRLRVLVHHLRERVERRLGLKRRPVGQELVKHRAQAVDVGERRDFAPLSGCLLRWHVGRRPHDGPSAGELAVALEPPGQAEVGDVGLSFAIQQDVSGLEVAVDDAALVGVVDCSSECGNQPRRLLRGAPEASQRAPLDQLHAEIGVPLELADLVNRHDPGMVEMGRRFALGAEAQRLIGRGHLPRQQHLEGHGAVKFDLPRPVDDAHASRAISPCNS